MKEEENTVKEQQIILKDIKAFELEHIFECGQCFRWNKQDDGSYIGVVKQGVLHVKKQVAKNELNKKCEQSKEKDIEEIIVSGKCEGDLQEIVEQYFDLSTDYEKIKQELSTIDDYLATSIEFGKGIRILNQDLWETIISFIISANNNIPRIKGIIERISQAYGNKIEYMGKNYYTFPTPEQLSKASVEDLRKLGLGFRDQRVYDTTKIILNKQITLPGLHELQDAQPESTEELREKLLTLPGVGPKVADCIMLFGMHRFEVFPIDVWVRRVMNELYIKQEDENKVNKKEIEKLAREKYSNLAGLAQQYLFYWKRAN